MNSINIKISPKNGNKRVISILNKIENQAKTLKGLFEELEKETLVFKTTSSSRRLNKSSRTVRNSN